MVIWRKICLPKVKPDDLKDGAPKQLLNKALFEVWSVLLADKAPDVICNNYCEGYLIGKFASLLESDQVLMYYLSYGTNGKANMVYIFKTIESWLNKELDVL